MKNTILTSFYLSTLVLSLWSCVEKGSQFDGQVVVSGKLENKPDGFLVLSRYNNDRLDVVDTIHVGKNGKFDYKLELEGPNFYELDLMGEKNVRLALYDEDVDITYDFSNDNLETEGSRDSQLLLKIDELTLRYQEEGNELNTGFYEAMADRDQETIRAIQEKAMQLEINHANRIKTAISEMEGSFAALAGLGMLNPRTDFNYLDSVIVVLGERYPDMRLIHSWKQELEEMRALSIGQPAPEISLPNPEGELVSLSGLRGKYVLIDFWAGWCKPCREENPNVVRLYNKYKDKGFEVFGVSLDRTKEMWLKAIEEDGLEWTQVSDLKYFNSDAAATYQINAIPATYMIDPDGNILAKDLRGKTLENKLAELFD
ncbi:redoxin domain-containing protein [Negadavirga shengliensis]|uniref:Redoxin domain-containing protein n=1 Tax=Negadavirga shengliensis TaxID=1389218 RepID=A0ABV9T1V0_9BACT